MSDVVIESVQREGLKAEVLIGDELIVRFEGAMREREPEDWLAKFFQRITGLIRDRTVIILDIRDLQYMNATAFRVLIPWLRVLRSRPKPCRLYVRTRASVIWQGVTISSLKAISGDMITAETDDS